MYFEAGQGWAGSCMYVAKEERFVRSMCMGKGMGNLF
jgi:hypothetical protein